MAMQSNLSGVSASTVDPAEIAKFSKLSEEWWDPKGKMAPLHKINPLRLTYIRDAACRKFERNVKSLNCLSGLRLPLHLLAVSPFVLSASLQLLRGFKSPSKHKNPTARVGLLYLVPKVGLEPTHVHHITDFESAASAIPPLRHFWEFWSFYNIAQRWDICNNTTSYMV